MLRRHQETMRHRHPHVFCDDVGKRELLDGATVIAGHPADLHVVRSGQENDFLRVGKFCFRGAFRLGSHVMFSVLFKHDVVGGNAVISNPAISARIVSELAT